ncbi:MAG: homocysteine S-methyltransferase family protein, partial [Gemmatimonadota bacterium]
MSGRSHAHPTLALDALPPRWTEGPASPLSRAERLGRLEGELARRILVLDGAMGTMIQQYRLTEAEYRGTRFAGWARDLRGNNDLLTLTQADLIRGIHAAYLEAGADILETNTFNSPAIAMADYGMESLAYELNVAGARTPRVGADAFLARPPPPPPYRARNHRPTTPTASHTP